MCPASPQSITRLAMLIPAPVRLARSVTSTTPLTGPLLACANMHTVNFAGGEIRDQVHRGNGGNGD
jgi:hypothetical protein